MGVIALDETQSNFLAVCNTNFQTINFMYKSGVFQILGGNAILSFDPKGNLKSIKEERFYYVDKYA